MKLTALAAVAVLALAGCGGKSAVVASSPTSPSSNPVETTTVATSTPTIEHGPEAYLVWAKAASFGDRDFASATDDQLMGVGNAVCGMLSTQPSFGNAVQLMVKIGGNPSVGEAEALVKEAVLDLCPQYKSLVP
jgi:hypothetical protein